MYKLIKLSRLFKMLKAMQQQSSFLENITSYFNLKIGHERIAFFLLIFIMGVHIMSCLWLIMPKFYNDDSNDLSGTWLEKYQD